MLKKIHHYNIQLKTLYYWIKNQDAMVQSNIMVIENNIVSHKSTFSSSNVSNDERLNE
jgi:hypothetical protein